MNNYTIAYKGLGQGGHDFAFDVDGTLFEAFENHDVKDARCRADVRVVRGGTGSGLTVTVRVHGTVTVACDRCLGDCGIPIDTEDEYDEPICATEDVIDLTQFIYESIVLALPYRRVHPDGQCDPDMIQRFTTESDN